MLFRSTVLDLEALRRTPLSRDPYEYLIVPGLVPTERANAVVRDFPAIAKPGLFPLSALDVRGAFSDIIDALDGEEFEAAMAEKFGVALAGKPKLFTIRGRCHAKDGGIHTDSTNKIVTVLLYLNPAWESQGGRLRVLQWSEAVDDGANIPDPEDAFVMATFRGVVSLGALTLTGISASLDSSLLAGRGGGQFPPRVATTVLIGTPVVLGGRR